MKGVRYGGKPKGWRKPEGVRKQHQIRAYDDEWELYRRFGKILKYGDKQACIDFIESQENK